MTDRICVIPDCGRPHVARGLCRTHYSNCQRGYSEWPPYIAPTQPTIAERFWPKVDKRGPDECWRWVGAISSTGYGNFMNTTAHRVSYELNVGHIPPRLDIDHLCGQRYCVNPAHLEAVTHQVNTQRGYAGSVLTVLRREWTRNRTHCKQGHEFTDENTYVTRQNWRSCRICRRISNMKVNARRKKARADMADTVTP